MTFHHAAAIVKRMGPCRIAMDIAAHTELARELALLGCVLHDVPAGDEAVQGDGPTVGFVEWPKPDSIETLAQALRPFAGLQALVLRSNGENRDYLERQILANGWNRHAAGMMAPDYGTWTGKALPELSFYQPGVTTTQDDLLGRPGQEADAAIARYAMAATHIRSGDTVLVDGADRAGGASILAALSNAGTIHRASDASLRDVSDHSIDTVVALDPTLPDGWVSRLDDYRRILTFDGRLILAIRQTTGRGDTLPTNAAALIEELNQRFLTELRYVQVPATPDASGPHVIATIDLDHGIATDWLFVIASANPLWGEGHGQAYRHPAFAGRGETTLTDFAAAYDNPSLYRAMVQLGERLNNEMVLARLAEHVIEHSRPGSADRGAAIAVLGYRLLEMRAPVSVPQILSHIQSYIDHPAPENDAPHVTRWKISLSFLAGRLSEMTGDHQAAIGWFRQASEGPWQDFSPILATKAVAGAFYEARLHLAGGDLESARQSFRRGVDITLRATAAPHATLFGDPDRPLPFYLTELAEVVDMGSQCANALAALPLHARDPGLFWRQVDVRRFGLVSWNRDLEKANEHLQVVAQQRRAA